MLIQFKLKNHKCFYEENILDLTATQEKRHLETTIDINGNKLLPLIAIYGANASGKSSFLEALDYMFTIIKNSNKFDINKDLPTIPFAFSNKAEKENSEYEISICLNDYEYRYGFSINKNGFDEEWLYKKKFDSKTRSSEKIIFERDKDNIIFSKSYDNYKRIWELFSSQKKLNTNKLLVLSSIAIKIEDGIIRDIFDYISKFNFKIESVFTPKNSVDILEKSTPLYNKFQKIINEFDPCLLGIKIEHKINDYEEKTYKISGIHKCIDNNKTMLLPLGRESDGTIKIFNIMPTILRNLEVGGVLCIDELDVSLHPLLFKKIINMYKDRKINKNNAQLIFTAHSTFLFNSENLRRDEIYLVENVNSFVSMTLVLFKS